MGSYFGLLKYECKQLVNRNLNPDNSWLSQMWGYGLLAGDVVGGNEGERSPTNIQGPND